MKKLIFAVRSLISILIGMLAALIMFGLLLAILWSFEPGFNPLYKFVTAIISGASSLVFGGAVASLIPGRASSLHSIIFGLVFGLITSAYILGASWLVPIVVLAFSLAAYVGGAISNRLFGIGAGNINATGN